MRSGGCAVQQELAGDAAAVMRQAVSLARRRGHAQVTPLHAASAMLADAGGLLRAACLRSRASSHPLQCKALELCFNVALNRLATAGAPMFPFHTHHAAAAGHRAPALSNALAAAFKRAQANQRRGGVASAEGQPKPAAARVELEQLVISILDDPGVSRVMREAGFSSAEVKANVEKAVMVSSSPEQSSTTAASCTSASPNPKPSSFKAKAVDVAGDAARVLDSMASGRHRGVAVVGDSAAAAEAVVKAVMDMVSKGDLPRSQHERLKNAQFVPFSASSFQRSPREEVKARAADLRALVREGRAAGKGVVLVLEDLGYAAEAWAAASWRRSSDPRGAARGRSYCPVEHAVMELSSLVRGGHDMFWLLGFGGYASYASCRSGQPSLEAVLELHTVVVPVDGSLALSLGGDSEITHCGADMIVATAASAPSWIRRCQQQGPVFTGSELTLSFSSPASSSLGGYTHYYDATMSRESWQHDPIDRRQPLLIHGHDGPIMAADSCDQRSLPANPNNPGSSSSVSKSNSSDGATAAQPAASRRPKFTELTAEKLKILCSALETRVPRHRDIVPAIASAVLRRRSGVTRTARPSLATWLLFQGKDGDGKTAMARELARLVFGSYAEFTCIAESPELTLAPSGSNSGDSLKRQRSPDDAHGGGYMQRFYEAIRENSHRVVKIDGGAEHDSFAGIKDAMMTGMVRGCDGDVVRLEDAIVVSCDEGSELGSRIYSPRPVKRQRVTSSGDFDSKVEEDDAADKGAMPRFGLDLNACTAIDGEGEEGSSPPHDMEILEAVDGVFLFRY